MQVTPSLFFRQEPELIRLPFAHKPSLTAYYFTRNASISHAYSFAFKSVKGFDLKFCH